MQGVNVWPSFTVLPHFRPQVLRYYHAGVALGKALFPLLALALDLEETFFDDKTIHPAAIMRLLRYPNQPPTSLDAADDRVQGIGAHTDYECFTILWQQSGVSALQVRNAQGIWIDAVPIPGTVVVK
jgi:isopenicillin N synthase-like dioxygenase